MSEDNEQLMQGLKAAMYGQDPTAKELTKMKIKAELDRLKTLVDEERLGCVIFTEFVGAGSRLKTGFHGDAQLIATTASHIVRGFAGQQTG